jgi:hypothetical protein
MHSLPAIAFLLLCLVAASPVRAADAPAASDDTDFLFRLGMMEGHLLVGHELIQAHKAEMALPHYGHPVKELYDDTSPYLARQRPMRRLPRRSIRRSSRRSTRRAPLPRRHCAPRCRQ